MTTIDRLAIETGLTRRSASAALAALVRSGVALIHELDDRRVVVTLPGLLTMVEVDEDDHRRELGRFADAERRVLH
ncbi:hypothetical protein [Hyphomicrobium sp.]|uniref:hypothetical protein n=1 Tax=Hyphomicrobium sp. TaxID=82 RepID=UPI003567A633